MTRSDWPPRASSGSAGRAHSGLARSRGRTGQHDRKTERESTRSSSVFARPSSVALIQFQFPLSPPPSPFPFSLTERAVSSRAAVSFVLLSSSLVDTSCALFAGIEPRLFSGFLSPVDSVLGAMSGRECCPHPICNTCIVLQLNSLT